MADSAVDRAAQKEFFRSWEGSGAAERANYSMFGLVESREGPKRLTR
jgi:hypothetical protein